MDNSKISDEEMGRIFDEYERNLVNDNEKGLVHDTQVEEVPVAIQHRAVTAPRPSPVNQRPSNSACNNSPTPDFSSKDLLALVKSYIEVEKRDELLMQSGGGLTYEERWAMIKRLYNNHRSRPTTRTSVEIQMAIRHFADACDRYTKIIKTVEDENIFKTNQATYDSRYLFEYGEEFVGYEAYKLRYSWLTRYGTE